MTDKKLSPLLTGLVCGAALMGLAGCGGGGGGGIPSASATPEGSTTALGSVAEPQMVGPTATATSAAASSGPSGPAPTLADCEMFPANAVFNTRIDDVSRFPVHPNSDAWVNVGGRDVPFSTDWGNSENASDATAYFGMPVNVVDGGAGTTQWPVVSFDFSPSGVFSDVGYADKSDCAVSGAGGFSIVRNCASVPPDQRRFPFPNPGSVLNQGGSCNDPHFCGDHPVLVVERGACRLWESFFAYNLSGQWYAMATAAWDLKSLSLRPNGWASASASGLPITPLLAKAAEANSGEIRHALRVNFSDPKLSSEVMWPARFAAGNDNPGAIPFGAVMRLKSGFVIPDDWTTQAKALATAAKRYGIYVSDNGADFYVQGEPSAAWDLRTNAQMRNIKMSDMEFVDLKSITTDGRFSIDSMQASW